MTRLLLDEEGIDELSKSLCREGVFIGKALRNGSPCLLFQYGEELIEVVYRVYRINILHFNILTEYEDYQMYLPSIENLLSPIDV